MTTTKTDSEQQAKAQLESIIAMVQAMESARESGDDTATSEAEHAATDNALVRGPWHSPHCIDARENTAPAEFFILLCTGGPAVRLVGTLSAYCEPESVRLNIAT